MCIPLSIAQSLPSEAQFPREQPARLVQSVDGLRCTNWYHRALVVAHVVASAWVAKLVVASAVVSLPFGLTAAVFFYLGHKAADPAHGLVHFAIDNYFRRTTPVVGGVVDGFLDHQETPAMITRIQFARNVAPLVALSLPVLVSLILIHPVGSISGVSVLSFLGTFFAEARAPARRGAGAARQGRSTSSCNRST